MLFELLTAANYMDIKPLLDLACLRVTFELSQKTAEEVSQSICSNSLPQEGYKHTGLVSPLIPSEIADSNILGSTRVDARGRSSRTGEPSVDL